MRISKHAAQRMAERGIDPATVMLTVKFGKRYDNPEGNTVVYERHGVRVHLSPDEQTFITAHKQNLRNGGSAR